MSSGLVYTAGEPLPLQNPPNFIHFFASLTVYELSANMESFTQLRPNVGIRAVGNCARLKLIEAELKLLLEIIIYLNFVTPLPRLRPPG